MEIRKLLTPYNYTNGKAGRVKYLVIHYVGATGGAEANCRYYASSYIGASAHYFVGFDGEIWQSVEERNIAWHCGSNTYRHPECRNSNSIGIELCVRNRGSQAATSKDWYFEDATVQSAVLLARQIMERYQIAPDHVLRHYDVTGKICPNPYVYNHTAHTWEQFKSAISQPDESKKSGWYEEDGGWRYYNGDTGLPIRNDWLFWEGNWYWFNGAGFMISDDWYEYQGYWYYLGPDGAMITGLDRIRGKWYYFDEEGRMATQPVTFVPEEDGALQFPKGDEV